MATSAAVSGGEREHVRTIGGHRPYRWRLHRAGILNVWFYYDQRFDMSGGRMILRGTNGAGKSRALELLLPYVLDADRRKVDATGAGQVQLKELMAAGHPGAGNRLGYVWVELERALDPADEEDCQDLSAGRTHAHLTAGAAIRYAKATDTVTVTYFLTPLRVDEGFHPMGADRSVLSVKELQEVLGEDHVTRDVALHQKKVAEQVFGLVGAQSRQRFEGLRRLLHTLRAPDVGNKIEQGALSEILADALPPLPETSLQAAGEKLDGLTETRAAQKRLEQACGDVEAFVTVYIRYAVGVLKSTAREAGAVAAHALRRADEVRRCETERQRKDDDQVRASEEQAQLAAYADELTATVNGIKESAAYRSVRELHGREGHLSALATAAEASLEQAVVARASEAAAVAAAEENTEALEKLSEDVDAGAAALAQAACAAAMPRPTLPRLAVTVERPPAVSEPVRTGLLLDAVAVPRPVPGVLHPSGGELRLAAHTLREDLRRLQGQARGHRDTAEARLRELHQQDLREQEARQEDRHARRATERAVVCTQDAQDAAEKRDNCAVELAGRWAQYCASPDTGRLMGDVAWADTAVAALLADPSVLCGTGLAPDTADGEELARIDRAALKAAGAARARLAADVARAEGGSQEAGRLMRSLHEERSDLQAAGVTAPPGPPWQSPDIEGTALWRAVDFAPSLDESERAGVESALLGSGLLTALVCEDGRVRASGGQVLLLPSGPVVLRSVRRVLTVAADCPLPAERVLAVLDRVALGSASGQATWVDTDGSWGNGPLSGRLSPSPRARYIGASARAAARLERLDAITSELEALEETQHACQEELTALAHQQEALEAHVAAAPACAALAAARHRAAALQEQAAQARQEGARAAARAEQARRDADAALAAHRDTCRSMELPEDHGALETVREAALRTIELCETVLSTAGGVERLVERHTHAMQAVQDSRAERIRSEEQAAARWMRWSQENAELAALREALGEEAHEVALRLEEAQAESARVRSQLESRTAALTTLAAAAATA
ncbi:hypothetical protein AB0I84_40505, partial [Streptomyces spectabilis]